VENMVSS